LNGNLLRTLLDLGHATSQNLDFAHRNESISFGEETITEMNLLEIRRRHPRQVQIRTFPKTQESAETGADWEWQIIGLRHTLKMRVQAKRVNKRGSIKGIAKRAPTSPMPQVDLLIRDAATHQMRPAYCFYSSEDQRNFWTKKPLNADRTAFEAGCLLADARTVKKQMPKRLAEIERCSVPWHYLWSRSRFELLSASFVVKFADSDDYRTIDQVWATMSGPVSLEVPANFPTVMELNGDLAGGTDKTGIFPTEKSELSHDLQSDAPRERGVALLMVVDVRSPDLMLRHFEPMPK
jgi:hypothetical protein